MSIFSIPIDRLSRKKILSLVKTCVREKRTLRISTINSEFLVEARTNSRFAKALRSADVRIRDGFGVGFLFWFRGCRAPDRVTGADLVKDMLAMAHTHRWTVFIINRIDGISSFSEIREVIQKNYPNIRILGVDLDRTAPEGREFRIKDSQIVFCSFGAPYQEVILAKLQERKLPAILMGVGGSFDFLTGAQKRAPRWMRYLGLEWLFRLLLQPSRIRRIFRAVVMLPVFLISVLAFYRKRK